MEWTVSCIALDDGIVPHIIYQFMYLYRISGSFWYILKANMICSVEGVYTLKILFSNSLTNVISCIMVTVLILLKLKRNIWRISLYIVKCFASVCYWTKIFIYRQSFEVNAFTIGMLSPPSTLYGFECETLFIINFPWNSVLKMFCNFEHPAQKTFFFVYRRMTRVEVNFRNFYFLRCMSHVSLYKPAQSIWGFDHTFI